MIVLNTIKKCYSRLDMDVKSGKSSISKKSGMSGDKPAEDPPKENPHKILNPLVI